MNTDKHSTAIAPYHYQPIPQQPIPQQQEDTNVVVINQPGPQTVEVRQIGSAESYLCCSLCLCILCALHGNLLGLACTLPACIISLVASTHNDIGEYEMASRLGSLACKLNIVAIIPTIVFTVIAIVGVIIGILFATGVIGSAANATT